MSSKNIRSSHGVPFALSADGLSVATVNGNQLTITQTSNWEPIWTTALHDQVKGRMKFLQWSKSTFESSQSSSITGPPNPRLLCASGNHISVLELHDEDWSAEIDAGDGTNFVHVDFAASRDEVLAVSEFGIQLTIFSLETGEQRVIKSPKFAGPNTYAFRPRTGHLAAILKIEAGEFLTVHELATYEVITTASIPTVDAQGLKWSPNGAWLAIWDAASAGTKVAFYTADGQLFRCYMRESDDGDFGVKTISWSPDSRLLAVGKHDGTVDLINSTTFTLIHVLGDPTSVRPIGRDVFLERPSGHGSDGREYALVPESPVFPFTYNPPSGSRIVSMISFNPTGYLIATVDQGLAHIVWMWSIAEGSPRLVGALIQKSNVRQLLWNPDLPELLTTTNDEDVASVHQWICGHVPRIALTNQVTGGRHSISWVRSGEESSGLIWLVSHSGYAIGYLTGSGASAAFNQISCLEDGHHPLRADDFPPM